MSKWQVSRSVLISFLVLAISQTGMNGIGEEIRELPLVLPVVDLLNHSAAFGLATGANGSGDHFAVQIIGPPSSGSNLVVNQFAVDENGVVGDPTTVPIAGDINVLSLGRNLYPKDPNDENSVMFTSVLTADSNVGIIEIDSAVSFQQIAEGQYLDSDVAATEGNVFVDAYNGDGSFLLDSFVAPRGPGALSFQKISAASPGVYINHFYGRNRSAVRGVQTNILGYAVRQFDTLEDEHIVRLIDPAIGSLKTVRLGLRPRVFQTDPPKESCITPVGTDGLAHIFAAVGGVLEGWAFDTNDETVRNAKLAIMPDNTPGFVPGIGCGPWGANQSAVVVGNQAFILNPDLSRPDKPWGFNVPSSVGATSLLPASPVGGPDPNLNWIFNSPGGSSPDGGTDYPPGTYLATQSLAEVQVLAQLVLPATSVVVSNLSGSEAAVSFSTLSPTGDPLLTREMQLAAFGSQRIDLAGSSSTLTPAWGWISSANSQISATATYNFSVNGKPIPNIGVQASSLSRGWGLTGRVNPNINTGIAVANPNSEDVACTLDLFSSNGPPLGNAAFDVLGGGQISQFLPQFDYDSGSLTTFDGSFVVNCTGNVSVLGVTQEAATGFIVTVPAVPILDRLIW